MCAYWSALLKGSWFVDVTGPATVTSSEWLVDQSVVPTITWSPVVQSTARSSWSVLAPAAAVALARAQLLPVNAAHWVMSVCFSAEGTGHVPSGVSGEDRNCGATPFAPNSRRLPP